MAYGIDSGFGVNGGGEQDAQANAAAAIQKQKQTPYAAKTGAALSNAAGPPPLDSPARGTAASPVTADGKINEANTAPPPPQPAPQQPAPQPAPQQPPQAQPAPQQPTPQQAALDSAVMPSGNNGAPTTGNWMTENPEFAKQVTDRQNQDYKRYQESFSKPGSFGPVLSQDEFTKQRESSAMQSASQEAMPSVKRAPVSEAPTIGARKEALGNAITGGTVLGNAPPSGTPVGELPSVRREEPPPLPKQDPATLAPSLEAEARSKYANTRTALTNAINGPETTPGGAPPPSAGSQLPWNGPGGQGPFPTDQPPPSTGLNPNPYDNGSTPPPGTTPPPTPPGGWTGVNAALAAKGLPTRPDGTAYTPGTLPQYTGGGWEGAQADVYGGGGWQGGSTDVGSGTGWGGGAVDVYKGDGWKGGETDVNSGVGWGGGKTDVNSGEGWGGGTLKTDPSALYGGSKFSQYQNQDTGGMDASTNRAVMNAINGPGPIDPELMKAKAKDDSSSMMRQLGQQSSQDSASRGMSGGGSDQAAQQRIQQEGVRGLLGNYRDIEMNAATANRNALMNAVGMGNTLSNSQVSRAGSQFASKNLGETSQATDTQAAVDSKNAANTFDRDTQRDNALISKSAWDSGQAAQAARVAQQAGNLGIEKSAFDSGQEAQAKRVAQQAGNLALSKDQWQSGLDAAKQKSTDQTTNLNFSQDAWKTGQFAEQAKIANQAQNLGFSQDAWKSQLAGSQQKTADQLANAGLSQAKWSSGITAQDTALKAALAQQGINKEGADSLAANYGTDTKNILAKMGIDTDKYNIDQTSADSRYRADITKEIGMGGIEADKYGTRMNAITNLLGTMEGARSNDQRTGTDWARILGL